MAPEGGIVELSDRGSFQWGRSREVEASGVRRGALVGRWGLWLWAGLPAKEVERAAWLGLGEALSHKGQGPREGGGSMAFTFTVLKEGVPGASGQSPQVGKKGGFGSALPSSPGSVLWGASCGL